MNGLPTPASGAGRVGLEALLSSPIRALLATDYDGTLAPIVTDPAQAFPQPGAVEALARLADQVGTLAVITGRTVESALELGGLESVSGLILLGSYGAQRWEDGQIRSVEPVDPQQTDAVRDLVRDAVREVVELGPSGTAVEVKGDAVAVHVRECRDPEAAQAALAGPLGAVAETYGLAVEPGRMVIELRPPGSDKGRALLELAEERESRTVVFLGDDLGDLAAFAAVDALRSQGRAGLAVASASAEAPEVAAAADLVVDGPAGVVRFLVGLADQLDALDRGVGR